MHQIMDWRAAVIAGLLAGALALVLRVLLWVLVTGGSFWAPFYQSAAILLGPESLAPVDAPQMGVVTVGVLVHMVLSLVYALVLAFIIHRWGLIIGIVGGALFGLAIYIINYYTFTYLFPWFFPLRSWLVLATHVFFGAAAGGLYEALERDIYVLDEPPTESTTAA
jgi:hypothetical protein